MSDREIFDRLIDNVKKYHPSDDFSLLESAYLLAKGAHEGQVRKSGEPFIIHPLEVAVILSELYQDRETLTAAILHDIIEDCGCSYEHLAEMFGEEVALLVDGVTNLEKQLEHAGEEEEQAENYRKMFFTMSKDIRVILIKIADRLHNLRTLQHMPPDKQRKKAQETLDIYAALAHKLGISKLRREIEDLSFQFLHPKDYKDLKTKVDQRFHDRNELLDAVVTQLDERMRAEGINAKIEGRAKHYFNIYKKMLDEDKPFSQIYDLFVVRILVKHPRDCYAALWIVHEIFKPLEGHFEDHIAIPKDNNYQSIHSVVSGPGGEPFSIQIRTHEMHRVSEYGITAQWRYKGSMTGLSKEDKSAAKYAWLREMLDWQRDISDNITYLDALKDNLNVYKGHIYCFTPKGDTKSLLVGSTALDFAYSVHSAVGNMMIGAKVNNRHVPPEYVLKTGDKVEILTSQNSKGPSLEWLDIAKTSQAKNKITHWFNSQNKEANRAKGAQLLAKAAENVDVPLSELTKDEYLKVVLRRYSLLNWDAVCAATGHGGIRETQIINRLYDEYKQANDPEGAAERKTKRKKKPGTANQGVLVKGIENPHVRLSQCCGPLLGDEIVAYVTRGRGVTVHRTDCANITALDTHQQKRLAEAVWENPHGSAANMIYKVELFITIFNKSGALFNILNILREANINIYTCNARVDKTDTEKGLADITFEVPSPKIFEDILARLNKLNGVLDIRRV